MSFKVDQKSLVRTLIVAGLFFVVANPMTYQLVQRVLGKFVTVASAEGLPTTAGLAIHSVVYAALAWLVMYLSEKYFPGSL